MKIYNKSALSEIKEIDSSIQSFDNVKKLTLRMMAMESYGNDSFSPFKDISSYGLAQKYIIAINSMLNRNLSSYSSPSAYIDSVTGVIEKTLFTSGQMSDVNSDYNKLIKDLGFYRKVLSNAVIMEYITDLFQGVMDSISLSATITKEQVAGILAQSVAPVFQSVPSLVSNVGPISSAISSEEKSKSIVTKIKKETL